MAKCFVIMPVTTPEHFLSTYNKDGAHFHHVLEHLFRPALEQLDFEVISPVARGADLIHAEIIRNLETADLVLCDMSIVNPNVFFELGVRTALNRPVCLVKDDATERVPFDTGIINFHTYLSELAPWTLDNQVQQLKEHISDSAEGSNGNNALWRYFGLTRVATPPVEETGVEAKVDRLTLQFEALNRRLGDSVPGSARSSVTTGTVPHIFVGIAYLEGSPAPGGTLVSAYRDDGKVVGSTSIHDDEGGYTLLTRAGQGSTIYFLIGNRPAQETSIWQEGAATRLNLNTTG